MIKRIEFEDHGQDFLWWDVDCDSYQVVDCGPFQSDIWTNITLINMERLETGVCPSFVLTEQINVCNPHITTFTLNYPIVKIEDKNQAP
jgi:hypothetical protein